MGGVAGTKALQSETIRFAPTALLPETFQRYYSSRNDYIIGARLGWRFNHRWSVQADGILRQMNGKSEAGRSGTATTTISPNDVVTWQFPVLLKYRFGGSSVRPFLEAGPSFRTAGNLNQNNPSHFGITAGGGVDWSAGVVRISPTVRFTRWNPDPVANPGFRITSLTAPNQLEFLLGFTGNPSHAHHPLGNRMSLGGILGLNLTGDFVDTGWVRSPFGEVRTASGNRHVIFGSSIQYRISDAVSISADALHRQYSRLSEGRGFVNLNAPGLPMDESTRFSQPIWEFPILARYRFPEFIAGWRPFAGAGPAFRLSRPLFNTSPYGVTAAVGVERRFGPVTLAPQLRLTNWRDRAGPREIVHRNNLLFLFGVSF